MAFPLIPLIGSLAPSLVKYLLGDKAGEVVEEVVGVAKDLFGSDDAKEIEKAIATDPAKALAFKEKLLDVQDRAAERAHQERLKEFDDIANARARQIATGDHTVPKLAAGILIVFGLTMSLVMWGCYLILTEGLALKDVNLAIAVSSLVGTVVGYIAGVAQQVVSYYFGSSRGSASKTDAMGEAIANFAKAGLSKRPNP